MIFRKACKSEEKAIKALYRSVIGNRYCTWDESYPGEEEIRGDLLAESLYVLADNGELIGAISIVPENELDSFKCWKFKENAREFARVVIRPDYQQHGLSGHLVEGVIRELLKTGASSVHIAVAKENAPAQKLYRKTGFSFCGEADMFGHNYYLCEKFIGNQRNN